MKNESQASIRETYAIAQRIDEKIDRLSDAVDQRLSRLEQRVASMEGRSAVIAIAWSSLVTVLAAVVGSAIFFLKK